MAKNIFRYLFYFCAALILLACAPGQTAEKNQKAANYNAQLGLVYLQHGDINLAKSKLLLANQQSPNDALVLDSMAYFLETTGEAEAAEHYYLQAIKYYPKYGTVQNNYGTFLCRHNRYQEAIKHFILATQDIHYLNTASAYENAGWCALKIPDKKLAKKYLQKSLANDPGRESAKKMLYQIS